MDGSQFLSGFTVVTGEQGSNVINGNKGEGFPYTTGGGAGGIGQGGAYLPYPTTKAVEEVRIVDPKTGGEKGAKLQRFSLIPTKFLWELAAHYGKGARKYADRNWERGYKWSLSEDAAMRHYNLWRGGERFDEETGSHHLIAAAWHLIALFIFDDRKIGTDDLTSLGDTPL